MFCKKCGNELTEGAKFCNKCGEQVIAMPGGNEKNKNAFGGVGSDNKNDNERKGLFAKNAQSCKRCGKTFEARLNKEYCPECDQILEDKFVEISGYVSVALDVNEESFLGDEKFYDIAIAHNQEVWNKFKSSYGFSSPADLVLAVSNYKSLSSEQGAEIIDRAAGCTVTAVGADIICPRFIMPGQYPGTIVDLNDVFAVGYARAKIDKYTTSEGLIQLFLTNDPFVPVFATLGEFRVGLFELKSKGGRSSIEEFSHAFFPNLQYPVTELKELKKQIKKECMVRGDIDVQVALNQVEDAMNQFGPYKKRLLLNEVPATNWRQLEEHGYIDISEARQIMHKNKKSIAFWNEARDIATQVSIL